MSYAQQKRCAYAVAILLAGLAVVQVADPADFGLTPVMVRWLGVLTAMLGVAAGFLPSVRGMGNDPGFLANRVSELSEHDRQAVVADVPARCPRRCSPRPPRRSRRPTTGSGGCAPRTG
jgi:hypothetical protein